jgi:hypothetical protein
MAFGSEFGPDLQTLVSQYAAEDFIAQRKRLRDARLRWIEENECPTSYQVDTRGKDGETVKFETPFQVGKVKYPQEYNDAWKRGARLEDEALEKHLLEGLDAVIKEGESPDTQKKLTVLVTPEGEQSAFFTGGDADVSPHPPIGEGESYDDYYARVSSAYEQQAHSTAGRRPVPSDDGVRESAAADSPGDGRPDAAGGSPGGEASPSLDCHPDPLLLLPGGTDDSRTPGADVHDAAAATPPDSDTGSE